MAIIIAGKRYTGKLTPAQFNEIFAAIKQLPQPDVVSVNDSPVNTDKSILCLQREVVYVDQLSQADATMFVGTKYLSECILVYLYSETDHLFIHVDETPNLNFTQYVKNFTYKNNLTVMLTGGHSDQLSVSNLKHVINELYKMSEELQIDITISKQKVLQANCFTAEDRYEFVHEKITQKIPIIARQFFGRSLDINLFKHRQPGDLKRRSVVKDPNYEADAIMTLATVFSQAVELYNSEEKAMLGFVFNEFKRQCKTFEKFLLLTDLFFSREGFEFMRFSYEAGNLFTGPSLYSFVISLHTKTVYRIGSYAETPSETKRMVAMIENHRNPSYSMYYDGHTDTYNIPKIAADFIRKCDLAKMKVATNFANHLQISKILDIKCNPLYLGIIVEFMREMDADKLNISTSVANVTFFPQSINLNKLYAGIVTHQNLTKLNAISKDIFVGMSRVFPHRTVDAFCACATEAAAIRLHQELNQKGIYSKLLTTKQGWNVCVPAINADRTSQAIEKSYKKLPINTLPVTAHASKLTR